MKALNRLLVFALIAGVIPFTGCDEDESAPLTLPSGLAVQLTEDPDTKGMVSLTATAEKVNFYSFTYSEDGETTVDENTDGISSYRFTVSGTYNIVVRAHTTWNDYTEVVKTVTFDFSSTGSGDWPTSGYSTPDAYPGWNLVWRDEFDGTSLNTDDWNYELGTGASGWGNNELQYYLQDNVTVGGGVLTIEANNNPFNSSNYTSSRITTEGKQSFQYGRVDIRAAAPYGKGIWPALWMLGNSHSSVGWPACGEIDIFEMVGGDGTGGFDDATAHGTVHWENAGQHAEFGGSTTLSSGRLADEWHVYSIVWDANAITWYMDDQQFHVIDITPSDLSEFQQNFFFIFNLAVGGNWPGNPDGSTVFPQHLYVDYVRVFQQ